MHDIDDPDRIQVLAERAADLHFRLRYLPEDIDPGWRRDVPDALMAWSAEAPPSRDHVIARLFASRHHQLPAIERLLDSAVALVLLEPAALAARLAALAIARRPGVLRSCIDGRVRQDLKLVLGSAYEPLLNASVTGMLAPAAAAASATRHDWALLGYHDWRHLLQPTDRPFLRVVRLSLPPTTNGARPLARAYPPQNDAAAAWAQLRAWWGGVAC